jgi:hypothetical protein
MGMFRSFAIQQYPVHRMIISEKVAYFLRTASRAWQLLWKGAEAT